MKKVIGPIAAIAITTILTHGFVFAGMYLERELPPDSYQGIFQNLVLALFRGWNQATGTPPLSHAAEFGRVFTPAIVLLLPLLGFAVFWLLSRQRITGRIWMPLAIVVMAMPLSKLIQSEWYEAARSGFVLLIMIATWCRRQPRPSSA